MYKKQMKYLLLLVTAITLLTSCSKSDTDDKPSIAQRTVIVYMSAENNLGGLNFDTQNIEDMATGSANLADNCRLLVFLDRPNAYVKPFIAQVTKDSQHPLDTLYRFEEDFYASDGAKFQEVVSKAIALAPAQDYGLVLWGHANGWTIERDTTADTSSAQRRAYGIDTGNNSAGTTGKWMNIPTMAKALQQVGTRFKFIFCDCCNMQSIEVAYELRNAAEYLIASPAEIDGVGAPYSKIVQHFFQTDDERMYTDICNDYHAQVDYVGGHLPISAIKTSQLEALAKATREVLPTVAANVPKDDFGQGHIYYYGLYMMDSWSTTFLKNEKTHYDMNDIIRWGLADDTAAYRSWRQAFDEAVVYSLMSTYWHANCIERNTAKKTFADFDVTAEAYGGVSMFFPQTKYNNSAYYKQNELIKKMAWYYSVGWSEAGW